MSDVSVGDLAARLGDTVDRLVAEAEASLAADPGEGIAAGRERAQLVSLLMRILADLQALRTALAREAPKDLSPDDAFDPGAVLAAIERRVARHAAATGAKTDPEGAERS